MQITQVLTTANKVFWAVYGIMQIAAVFIPKPKSFPRLLKS